MDLCFLYPFGRKLLLIWNREKENTKQSLVYRDRHSTRYVVFGRPEIDLFTSRVNAKCERYVSWRKDPAMTIDAFTINWQSYNFYAFPPFSVILKMLKKIQSDQTRVAIHCLPSQAWYFVWLCLNRNLFTSNRISRTIFVQGITL